MNQGTNLLNKETSCTGVQRDEQDATLSTNEEKRNHPYYAVLNKEQILF